MMQNTAINGTTMTPLTGASSEWATEMQSHFARTGAYRTEDITRVLGSPTQGLSLPSQTVAGNEPTTKKTKTSDLGVL